MGLKPLPITRTLVATNKYELIFFMYSPNVLEMSSKYSVTMNPMLFFQKKVTNYSQMTQPQLMSRRFRIKPRNLYRIIKFLEGIIAWFYDPTKENLFVITKDNRLVFNNDYRELNLVVEKGYFEDDLMKAIPAIVEGYQGESIEGIHLFINQMENQVDLSLSELEYLHGILSTFDFNSEVTTALEAIRYSAILNNGEIPVYDSNQPTSGGFGKSRSGFANI